MRPNWHGLRRFLAITTQKKGKGLPDNQQLSHHGHLKCHEHCSTGRKEALKVASACSWQRSIPMLSPSYPVSNQIVVKARAEEDNWAWPYHQVPKWQLHIARWRSRKFKEQAPNWWDPCGSVKTNILIYKQKCQPCHTLMVFTVKAAEFKLFSRAILHLHQSCHLCLQYLVYYHFFTEIFFLSSSTRDAHIIKEALTEVFLSLTMIL